MSVRVFSSGVNLFGMHFPIGMASCRVRLININKRRIFYRETLKVWLTDHVLS